MPENVNDDGPASIEQQYRNLTGDGPVREEDMFPVHLGEYETRTLNTYQVNLRGEERLVMFVPPGGSGITAVDCDRTFEFSSPVETFRATVKSVSWEHGEPMVRVVPTRDGVNECAGCGTHDETTRYGIATESTMGEVDLCDGCLEWLRGSDDGCSICTDDSSGHDSITEIADPDEAEHFPLCKECRMEADHGEHPIVHERARRRREQRDDDWGLE